MKKSIRALALAGLTGVAVMAAVPSAEAHGWRRGPSSGAVVAGVVGGLALGALAGAALASPAPPPRAYYAPPPPPPAYYAPPVAYYAPPPPPPPVVVYETRPRVYYPRSYY
ncbi:hypothetical protein HMPREF9946_04060 [Acetobacteraceae bacterium AT-5844]|nr:hypothetical protein HMPREF9946_04060 [Acetobacteraceae bacterium AT-5844]